MSDTRHRNVRWNLGELKGAPSWDQVKVAVLMDIRDELQSLNRLLHCANFTDIPFKLDRIAKNTVNRTRRKKDCTAKQVS